MNLTLFREEIERVGNQHIEDAIKELKSLNNLKYFTDVRSRQQTLLLSKCNEVLNSYLNKVDSKPLVPHLGLGKMVTLTEVVINYYYTVFPPISNRLSHEMADLHHQKFSDSPQ